MNQSFRLNPFRGVVVNQRMLRRDISMAGRRFSWVEGAQEVFTLEMDPPIASSQDDI